MLGFLGGRREELAAEVESWALPPLEQSRMAMIPKKSHLALWQQSEIGLLNPRRPSPVFVHQYQAAVRRMGEFLERHRQDNSIRLVEPGGGESGGPVDVGPDGDRVSREDRVGGEEAGG